MSGLVYSSRFSIAPDTARTVQRGKYPLQRRKTGVPVHERALLTDPQRGVRRRGRPRYDPGTYDSYCARSRNERSLHDLPLLDPARSPICRYSDLLIANNAPHTGRRSYPRPPHRYDYVSIDAEVDASRVENGRYTAAWRVRRGRDT